jgi:hypothetical protein
MLGGLDCTNLPPETSRKLYRISMSQRDRTLQETTTSLTPAQALEAAKLFFARQNGIYAAYPDQEGPSYLTLRGQGGEEVAIAAVPGSGGTRVTGSTYLFDQQVARFLATLAPVPLAVATASGK